MLLKLYALTWALGLFAVGVFYFTGNFTPLVAITFGFLSFGAIFMGLIGVLPFWATHTGDEE